MNNQEESNIDFIFEQISKKQGSCPYYANGKSVTHVITDMDHFPYTRYFRGDYTSSIPTVYGRDAGWRPRCDSCYSFPANRSIVDEFKPNHCFSGPCSLTTVCRPQKINTIADKDFITVSLNDSCVPEYR